MLKGAQFTGKICTTVLFISLTLLLMMPDIPKQYVPWIALVDGIFLLIAFVDYIFVYIRKDSKFQTVNNKKA